MEVQSKDTYTVEAHCLNCDFSGKIEIRKGMKVIETECTTCGVADLQIVKKFYL